MIEDDPNVFWLSVFSKLDLEPLKNHDFDAGN